MDGKNSEKNSSPGLEMEWQHLRREDLGCAATAIALFDNCGRDPTCELLTIFDIAGLASFESITEKAAFDENSGILGLAQDAEVGRVHATIS